MSEKILASNLTNNPTGAARLSSWNLSSASRRDDGRWEYYRKADLADSDTYGVWIEPEDRNVNTGDVAVVIVELSGEVTDDPVGIQYANRLLSVQLSDSTWLVAASSKYAGTRFPIQFLCGDSAVILNAGIFRAECWPTVHEWYETKRLAYPWFDGDTRPKKENL